MRSRVDSPGLQSFPALSGDVWEWTFPFPSTTELQLASSVPIGNNPAVVQNGYIELVMHANTQDQVDPGKIHPVG